MPNDIFLESHEPVPQKSLHSVVEHRLLYGMF